MDTKDSKYWISHLNLEPHPDSGYYREVYRSTEQVTSRVSTQGIIENRAAATSIYFLLEKDQFSTFHYLESEETWVIIDGDTI